ncbi:hypothetical protein ACQKML_28505 [Peribacillus frigoritolerans]
MNTGQEQAIEETLRILKKQLEPYKKIDYDYYLKTIGELEKVAKKFQNPEKEE